MNKCPRCGAGTVKEHSHSTCIVNLQQKIIFLCKDTLRIRDKARQLVGFTHDYAENQFQEVAPGLSANEAMWKTRDELERALDVHDKKWADASQIYDPAATSPPPGDWAERLQQELDETGTIGPYPYPGKAHERTELLKEQLAKRAGQPQLLGKVRSVQETTPEEETEGYARIIENLPDRGEKVPGYPTADEYSRPRAHAHPREDPEKMLEYIEAISLRLREIRKLTMSYSSDFSRQVRDMCAGYKEGTIPLTDSDVETPEQGLPSGSELAAHLNGDRSELADHFNGDQE